MSTAAVHKHAQVSTIAMPLAILLAIAYSATAHAAPPINALPMPYFCFDADSPSVQAGFVGAADVLVLAQDHPRSVISGSQLGLADPDDRLTSLSGPHSEFTPDDPFVILFSVDRATLGVADPDPELVVAGVPYNVRDQAWRGHAAGDQFISTAEFTLAGGCRNAGSGSDNSVLGRNNFDEGGTDFQADPPTSASSAPLSEPQDDLSCTAYLSATRGEIEQLYFTAAGSSPSLQGLSDDNVSGANIYYNSSPQSGGVTQLYALSSALNLQEADNIDAMVVFDVNVAGRYDSGDAILFSLAPGSPSLSTIPGASSVGAAADVFLARSGFSTSVFAAAARFGLGTEHDNINALELYSCDNASYSATDSGIRALRGDLNCDDVVDELDVAPFSLALTDPSAYYAAFPGGDVMRADADRDGAVNAVDIDAFLEILTGGE
jgi:hypothetical protein